MKVIHKCQILVFCILLLSCKKENDVVAPVISITNPISIITAHVYDIINVKAHIYDNQNITFVRIELLDGNFQQVIPSVEESVNASAYDINRNIYINNIHIVTGTYWIRVVASDGINDASSYQEITIIEEPKSLLGILLVSSSGSAVSISKVDSVFGLTSFYNIIGDYSGSVISSYDQFMAIAGSYNSPLSVIGLQYLDIWWQMPSVNAFPAPYFNELLYSEQYQRLYSSIATGNTKTYNVYGNQTNNYSALGGYGSYKIGVFSDVVCVEETQITGTDIDLVVYYRQSGALKNSILINSDVVGFFEENSDNILVFSNTGTQGLINSYSVSANNMWEPITLPIGKINDVVQISSDIYAIAHDSGILIYNYSSNSITNIVSGIIASKLAYDEVNNRMFAAQGALLAVYDLNGNALTSVINGQAIDNILVWYNK